MISEDLKYIADHYGLKHQLEKCKEELNELIEALGSNCDIHLAEEIADVEIMILQIKYLRNIPDEQVDVIMQYKIQRQLRRIENGDGAQRVESEQDVIKSPSHYMLDGLNVEAIDVIKAVLGEDGFKAHCRGCALKYLLRADKKNRTEDLKKARVYLNWEIEYGCDN
jgi:protein 1.7 protein|nr:MAG TPA: nucelotide kinase [Caudoviricetes sp.]